MGYQASHPKKLATTSKNEKGYVRYIWNLQFYLHYSSQVQQLIFSNLSVLIEKLAGVSMSFTYLFSKRSIYLIKLVVLCLDRHSTTRIGFILSNGAIGWAIFTNISRLIVSFIPTNRRNISFSCWKCWVGMVLIKNVENGQCFAFVVCQMENRSLQTNTTNEVSST